MGDSTDLIELEITMQVNVKSLLPPRKSGILAHATVEIELEGQRIILSDLRVLQNKSGELWVGMPSVAIQDGGKAYHYEPVVELGRELKRAVEDTVLARYEEWAKQQTAMRP
jgi:DNA-binding cell septation regulator SpoVG